MQELNLPIKWPYKLESSFTTAWGKMIKDKWWYFDKISDWSIWAKKIDCYIITNKWSYICEIKVIDKDIFHIKRLRPNQLKALRLTNKLWWNAILCVYSKSLNKYKLFSFNKIKNLTTDESVKLIFDN